MKNIVNIKYILISLAALVFCSCNFCKQEKKIHSNVRNVSSEKVDKEFFMLKNITDSILQCLYQDSTKSFITGEKNFFAVYKYSQKGNNSKIYQEVLKKEFDLDNSEYISRFHESKIKLNPTGINLNVKIYEDSDIKYNSFPGYQKVLLLNENAKTISLYFSDSLVFSNDRKMHIYMNVRDKIFVSNYEYDVKKEYFVKKNEELYKKIE
ncbi:hypothetical protein D3C72_1546070 [compost metagenome]